MINFIKQSNYTGLDTVWFDLDDYLKSVDQDLKNLFIVSSPRWQFGSGSQYEILTNDGGSWSWSSSVGNWNITGDRLYAGAGSTYIGLQPGTGIFLGDSTFASAVFSVDQNGVIKAHSGKIGGWNINTYAIKDHTTDNNANILLDSTLGLMRIGPNTGNNYITIDGKGLMMQSSDYVSGPLGSGWGITPDISEFQNIRARGMFKTATFEYDVISALGGNLLIANADILDVNMTSNDNSSLIITTGTYFRINDILRIKDGVYDEWLKISASTTAYTYTVTRDMDAQYGANLNPTWKKGTCVVSYGSDGNGVIFMDGAGPNIDVLTHTGSPYDYAPTQLRIGNLNGFLGYTTKAYGIAIGNALQYLKYDTANGLRIAGHTLLGELEVSTGGYIRSGQTTWNSGTGYYFDYNVGTPRFSLGASGGNRMTWNGSSLNIVGSIDVSTFTGSTFTNCSMSSSSVTNCGMAGISANNCNFTTTSFTNSSLNSSSMTNCGMSSSSMSNCAMNSSSMTNCGMTGTSANNCNFTNSTITNSGINISTMTNCSISGSNVSNMQTAFSGARVRILPDTATGLAIYDDSGNSVLQAMVGGTNVGDVIFGLKSSIASEYPTQDTDHVKATTSYTGSPPYFATDPTKSLTGGMNIGNDWLSNWAVVTNQRFHIDLNSAKTITRIYYENVHDSGGYTDRGVKNFTFWGSNTEASFLELTYATDTGWTQITTAQSTFDQHTASDIADPKYITVTNTTAYRYYAFKFADNWGSAGFMGVRRIELQSGSESAIYMQWDKSAGKLLISNLQSTDYISTTTGYKLSGTSGLEINTGTIQGIPLISKLMVYAMMFGSYGG